MRSKNQTSRGGADKIMTDFLNYKTIFNPNREKINGVKPRSFYGFPEKGKNDRIGE
jgi:hypothetical protein